MRHAGVALVQVLLLAAALLGLAISSLVATRSDQMISASVVNGTKAFWAAAAGVEAGRAWLRANVSTAVLPQTFGPVTVGEGSYQVTIDRQPTGGFRIRSIGTAPENARRIVEEIASVPGFDADLGLIQIDGFGTPTDMEDPAGGPGVRIPDWTIDARGHYALTGALDPSCPGVPALAGPQGNDPTDAPRELDKLRCRVVQRANECCNPDGTTNTSACIESPGVCAPQATCGDSSCLEGRCTIGSCTATACSTSQCASATCSLGACSPGTCSDTSCGAGRCEIGTCLEGTCADGSCLEGRCAGGICEPGTCGGEPGCVAGTCPIGACSPGDCLDASCTAGTCPVVGCTPGICSDPSTCVAGTCPVLDCAPGTCSAGNCVVASCALDCARLCPDGLCEFDPGLHHVRNLGYYTPFRTDLTPFDPDPPSADCDAPDPACCKQLDLGDPALRAVASPPGSNLPLPPHDRGPLLIDTPADTTDDFPVNVLTSQEQAALRAVIDEVLDAALAAPESERLCITDRFRGGTHVYGSLSPFDPKIVIVADPRDQNPKMQTLSTLAPCPGRGRVNNLVIEDGAVFRGAGVMILPRELEVKDATFDWKGLILVLENGKIKVGPSSCGAVYGGVLLQTNPTRNNARLDFDHNLAQPACGAPNQAFSINFSCDALNGSLGGLLRTTSWQEIFGG